MKIITENAAYVQKNAIAYWNQTMKPIPASIFLKVFGEGVVIIDDNNRYDLVKFENPVDIEIIKNADWIPDYNEIINLSEEEITNLGMNISKQRNQIAHEYNALDEEEKSKRVDLVIDCELLEYKMYALRDILWIKLGHLTFPLPDEAPKPDSLNIANRVRKFLNKKKRNH